MSKQTETDTESRGGSGTEPTGDDRVRAHPTIRPTLIWMVLTLFVGLLLSAVVQQDPELVGGTSNANIVLNVTLGLTAVVLVRLLVRILVLYRTEYVVTDSAIRREYSLLFQSRSTRVPISMVRSNEMRQSRLQRLLGYGTLVVNRGLGDVELENVPEPERLREEIQDRVIRASS